MCYLALFRYLCIAYFEWISCLKISENEKILLDFADF